MPLTIAYWGSGEANVEAYREASTLRALVERRGGTLIMAPTLEGLKAVRDRSPDIVHLSAHGFPGGLEHDGKTMRLEAIQQLVGEPKLLFVGACNSFSILNGRRATAGVGFDGELHPYHAIEASLAFYKSLFAGDSLRDAVKKAEEQLDYLSTTTEARVHLVLNKACNAKEVLCPQPHLVWKKTATSKLLLGLKGYCGVPGVVVFVVHDEHGNAALVYESVNTGSHDTQGVIWGMREHQCTGSQRWVSATVVAAARRPLTVKANVNWPPKSRL